MAARTEDNLSSRVTVKAVPIVSLSARKQKSFQRPLTSVTYNAFLFTSIQFLFLEFTNKVNNEKKLKLGNLANYFGDLGSVSQNFVAKQKS